MTYAIALLIAFACISSTFCLGAVFGGIMSRRSLEDEYASRYLSELQTMQAGGDSTSERIFH